MIEETQGRNVAIRTLHTHIPDVTLLGPSICNVAPVHLHLRGPGAISTDPEQRFTTLITFTSDVGCLPVHLDKRSMQPTKPESGNTGFVLLSLAIG